MDSELLFSVSFLISFAFFFVELKGMVCKEAEKMQRLNSKIFKHSEYKNIWKKQFLQT